MRFLSALRAIPFRRLGGLGLPCSLLPILALWTPVVGRAQAHRIDAAPAVLNEAGAPMFSIRGHEAMGLDSPPTDLHVLPDGRLLVVGDRQIAFGDGVRWESFRQSPADHARLGTKVNVSATGEIFMGVDGGFARLELGADARWQLRRVATWDGDGQESPPVLGNAIAVGDEWFWHSDSGPLVAWQPGRAARTVGHADTIEQVLRLGADLFLSDRTDGRLWRITAHGAKPVEYTAQISASETLTCGVPFDREHLLVGTYARGLQLFDGRTTKPFITGSRLDDDARINDLCALGAGRFAAAVEGYGIVFFDAQGRIMQVLAPTLDRRLGQVRRLVPAAAGMVVGLLSDGILRVEFPSRVSHFEPLLGTSLTTAHPYRFEGRLWLMADGNMSRANYDVHGRLTGFEVDTPPRRFVFSFSTALGRPVAGTDRGAFYREAGGWKSFAPESVNLRVLDPHPIGGRWLYGANHELGWLKPTADGIEVESFAAPQLDKTYNVETDADGSIWIEQGNGRFARVRLIGGRPSTELYDRAAGVPEGWAQVFKLGDKVGFNVGGQILRFDEGQRRFVPDETFARRFPGYNNVVGRPVRDALGRVWITANGAAQILEERDGAWHNLGQKMPPGFQPYYFTCEESGVVWMHADRRLARFDPSIPVEPAPPIRALLTHLGLPKSGRTLFAPLGEIPALAYADNSLVAHFAASHTPFSTSVEFDVMLAGVGGDKRWVPAGGGGTAVFNHLKEGGYVLHVRPRTGTAIGEEATLAFSIEAPWYRSLWAYFVYFVSALGVVVLSGRVTSYLGRRETARLERLVAERTRELNEGVERRLRLEAQLLQAQKLESLGTLAGGIAHDFNNLLTSILGNCELALLNTPEGGEVRDDLQGIRTAALRAKDLVAQILTFSRKGNIKLTPLDLAQPVGEALKLIRRSTPTTIEIDSSLASGTVQADATQVQQIVLNLCNNAIHAMRGQGGRLAVTLAPVVVDEELAAEIHDLQPGAAMRLTVADNGRGMDAATLGRIFDPFFTTKSPGEGTGLGLAIVRGIVHSHHGALRVRSTPGQGTTFELFFPRTTAPVAVAPATPQAEPASARQEILIVDDERAVADFVAKRLEKLGYRTTVFHEPHAALAAALAERGRFHALVTDLTMPGLTGLELIQRLRSSGDAMPAVIITGYGTDAVRNSLSTLPACVVLPKPFAGDELARALREILPAAGTGRH